MIIAINFPVYAIGKKRLEKNWLVEHRTGIAEVMSSNPVEALRLLSNCLNWKIYCDDHSSLSSTAAMWPLWEYRADGHGFSDT